jgi:hypothetical protein
MKFRDHFSIVILVVAIVGTAFSQESTENDKKSGSDLQAWLAVAIEKNGISFHWKGQVSIDRRCYFGMHDELCIGRRVVLLTIPSRPSQGPTASSGFRINRRDMKQTSSYGSIWGRSTRARSA